MKTFLSLAMAALFLTGCTTAATSKQNDPIVKQLMGKPTSYLEQKLGLPNKRNETMSGAMVWVYLDDVSGMDKKSCTVTLSIRNETVEHVVVDAEGQSLFSLVTGSCPRIRKNLGV